MVVVTGPMYFGRKSLSFHISTQLSHPHSPLHPLTSALSFSLNNIKILNKIHPFHTWIYWHVSCLGGGLCYKFILWFCKSFVVIYYNWSNVKDRHWEKVYRSLSKYHDWIVVISNHYIIEFLYILNYEKEWVCPLTKLPVWPAFVIFLVWYTHCLRVTIFQNAYNIEKYFLMGDQHKKSTQP